MFFDLVIPSDGRAFIVRPGTPITIGRMPQCEVQVDDLGSANGT